MKLVLGTAQFGFDYGLANRTGKIEFNEARSIINHAWKNSICTLDTAYAYGDSEKILGDIGINDWEVISKLPSIHANGKTIKTIVKESLERLKLDKIHTILFHRAEDLLEGNGSKTYRELVELKDAGVVDKIGASIYSPIILDEIISNYDIDVIQAPINILDNRLLKSGWISKLKSKGIELHARSIFLQGVLLMPPNERPEYFNKWQHVWSKWDNFLKQTNQHPAAVCLPWILSLAEVDKVIVGVDSLSQLEKLIDYTAEKMSAEFIELNCDDPFLLDPFNWNIS